MNLFLDGRSLAMRTTGQGTVIHIVLPGTERKNYVLGHATKNKHFLKSGIIIGTHESLHRVSGVTRHVLRESHIVAGAGLFITLN